VESELVNGWETIHAFIEPNVLSDLDNMRLGIMPEDILISVGCESKEDPSPRVGDELCRSSTWTLHPHSAAESAQSRKIILLSSSDAVWRDKSISRNY